jgi:hypothetical protein
MKSLPVDLRGCAGMDACLLIRVRGWAWSKNRGSAKDGSTFTSPRLPPLLVVSHGSTTIVAEDRSS